MSGRGRAEGRRLGGGWAWRVSELTPRRAKDERRKQRGAIVSVASLCGQVAIPQSAAYIASKHAVIGLAKSATLEYAGKGIRV